MASNSRIKPSSKHWALYQQQPYQGSALTTADKLERLAYILLGAVLLALLMPLLPSRRRDSHIRSDWDEYLAKLMPCSVVALLVATGAFYEYIAKPTKKHRLGYRLVGQFVVRSKQKFFGKVWLELEPNELHRVPVEAELYDRIQKGDTVRVVYSATEDLISVSKIITPAARS